MHRLTAVSTVEFWSGAGLLAWGVWVWIDPHALIAIAVYEPIVRYIPDQAWAYFAIAVGAWQAASRAFGGRAARFGSTLAAAVIYKIVAVSNMVSVAPTPTSMLLCAWALADIAALVRLAR